MTFRIDKVVAALPAQLEPDTLYAVRVGAGFDLYMTDALGETAHALNGPGGIDGTFQPFLGRGKIGRWNPAGSGTVVTTDGLPAPSNLGTATARNPAATNMFTRTRRIGYASAATAGSLAGARDAAAQFTLGDGAGLGGFRLIIRFGFSALTADARAFIGMRQAGAPTNVEPATLNNCIGIGRGAADTTLSLFSGGSAAQAPIALGANFPANTVNVDLYELELHSPADVAQTCHWKVTRINTGHVASGTLTGGAAVLPVASTFLTGGLAWVTNNATASAVAIDIASLYIETDF